MSKKYDGEQLFSACMGFFLLGLIVMGMVLSVCNIMIWKKVDVLGDIVCPENTEFDKIENDVIYCKNIPTPEPEKLERYEGTLIPITNKQVK